MPNQVDRCMVGLPGKMEGMWLELREVSTWVCHDSLGAVSMVTEVEWVSVDATKQRGAYFPTSWKRGM